MGRPTSYKPEYCQQLIEHLEKGYSFESFAGMIKVDRSTLFDWVEKQPDFKEAKEEAELRSLFFWETLGISGTVGKIPGFNVTSWIFNMKNRFKWKDRHDYTSDDDKLEVVFHSSLKQSDE